MQADSDSVLPENNSECGVVKICAFFTFTARKYGSILILMNLFTEYAEYLKDNPQGYWFKSKLYGIGWIPARREGWAVLAVYLLFVLGLATLAPKVVSEAQAITHVIAPIFGATILFLVITWKTGEPLRWHWGKKHGE